MTCDATMMMMMIDQLLRHRSVRRYTDEPVADTDIRAAVEAGQAASTSSAIQAYSMIRIRNADTRCELIALTGGQDKVAEAGAFFVICGDTRRHRLCCAAHGCEYDATLEGFLLAVVDATLFAQNLVIALEAMGYGICYIGGLRNQLSEVDRLLDLPTGVYPLYGLCVGRPAEPWTDIAPRPRLQPEAVVFDERYPDDDAVRAMVDEYDARYCEYMIARGVPAETCEGWSQRMAKMFSTPRRPDVGRYYQSKGARLE